MDVWYEAGSISLGVTLHREVRGVFYNRDRDVSPAVHGDDFTFCGCQDDLFWIRDLTKTWFEVRVRAILGPEVHDDKE
eukprot:4770576-Karenia_brevis.AAC.1